MHAQHHLTPSTPCTCHIHTFPPLPTPDVLCSLCHLTPCTVCTHVCLPVSARCSYTLSSPVPSSQAVLLCPPALQPFTFHTLCTHPVRLPCSCLTTQKGGGGLILAWSIQGASGALPWFPPQLPSFLPSHPCSSFLPFDVPPLLCSRVRTAHQMEMTSPHPAIRCNYKLMLFPNPCSVVH